MNTPLHIQLLLHVYAIAEPIPNRGAPAVEAYLNDLVSKGLIAPVPQAPSGYRITPTGRTYVERLKEVLSLKNPNQPLVDEVQKAVPPKMPPIHTQFLVTRGQLGIAGFRLRPSLDEAVAEAKKCTEASGGPTVVWKPVKTVSRYEPPTQVVDLP